MAVPELRHVIHAYEAVADHDVVHDHTVMGPFYSERYPGPPGGHHHPRTVQRRAHRPLPGARHPGAHRRHLPRPAAGPPPTSPSRRVIHHGLDAVGLPLRRRGGRRRRRLLRLPGADGARQRGAPGHRGRPQGRASASCWPPRCASRGSAPTSTSRWRRCSGPTPSIWARSPTSASSSCWPRPGPCSSPSAGTSPSAWSCSRPWPAGRRCWPSPRVPPPRWSTTAPPGFLCDDEDGHGRGPRHGSTSSRRADCRAAVEGYFSTERMVADHVELYEELAKALRAPGARGRRAESASVLAAEEVDDPDDHGHHDHQDGQLEGERTSPATAQRPTARRRCRRRPRPPRAHGVEDAEPEPFVFSLVAHVILRGRLATGRHRNATPAHLQGVRRAAPRARVTRGSGGTVSRVSPRRCARSFWTRPTSTVTTSATPCPGAADGWLTGLLDHATDGDLPRARPGGRGWLRPGRAGPVQRPRRGARPRTAARHRRGGRRRLVPGVGRGRPPRPLRAPAGGGPRGGRRRPAGPARPARRPAGGRRRRSWSTPCWPGPSTCGGRRPASWLPVAGRPGRGAPPRPRRRRLPARARPEGGPRRPPRHPRRDAPPAGPCPALADEVDLSLARRAPPGAHRGARRAAPDHRPRHATASCSRSRTRWPPPSTTPTPTPSWPPSPRRAGPSPG